MQPNIKRQTRGPIKLYELFFLTVLTEEKQFWQYSLLTSKQSP